MVTAIPTCNPNVVAATHSLPEAEKRNAFVRISGFVVLDPSVAPPGATPGNAERVSLSSESDPASRASSATPSTRRPECNLSKTPSIDLRETIQKL